MTCKSRNAKIIVVDENDIEKLARKVVCGRVKECVFVESKCILVTFIG